MSAKIAEALPEVEDPTTLPLTLAWLVPVLLGIAGLVNVLGVGFGFVATAVAVGFALAQVSARSELMDATLQLDPRARLVAWVILTMLFFFPGSRFGFAPDAGAPAGFFLVGLALFPLAVWPTICHLLGAALLLQWWSLIALEPTVPLPLAFAGMLSVLAGFSVTHQHFRHLRHGQAQPSPLPALGATGLLFAAGALIAFPLALLLRLALGALSTPAARPTPGDTAAPRSTATPLTEIPEEMIIRMMIELGLIAIGGFILLYLLGHVLARLRRKRGEIALDIAREEPWEEEWTVPPAPQRRRRQATSARERIIEAYAKATGAMVARGWEFPAAMTAREFDLTARDRAFVARERLDGLTNLFERAHYGAAEPREKDVEEAASLAKEIRRAVDQKKR